jgi:hypothetical protein
MDWLMRCLALFFACLGGALGVAHAGAADNLRVIIVDGDDAANFVAERLAAEPVIEVRDKDDRRVPGAVVRFVIRKTRDRLIASSATARPKCERSPTIRVARA